MVFVGGAMSFFSSLLSLFFPFQKPSGLPAEAVVIEILPAEAVVIRVLPVYVNKS